MQRLSSSAGGSRRPGKNVKTDQQPTNAPTRVYRCCLRLMIVVSSLHMRSHEQRADQGMADIAPKTLVGHCINSRVPIHRVLALSWHRDPQRRPNEAEFCSQTARVNRPAASKNLISAKIWVISSKAGRDRAGLPGIGSVSIAMLAGDAAAVKEYLRSITSNRIVAQPTCVVKTGSCWKQVSLARSSASC